MSEYSRFRGQQDTKLMTLFVSSPDYIKRICITDRQVDIVKDIALYFNNCMTAKELSDHNNISIQSASTQLSNLWKTGYVERRDRGHTSGGGEYIYKVIDEVAKEINKEQK